MQIHRLAHKMQTNWLVAALTAMVIGAISPSALGAGVLSAAQDASVQQGGLQVVVLVDVSSRAGDIGAHTLRGVVTNLYSALEPGDQVTILAAARYAPMEVLSIVVRETDDAGALVARSWRERAEPLAGRPADVARGLSRFLEARGNTPLHLLIILPSTRLGGDDASAIWAGAKTARDRGALVWAAGPDDADLRQAAATGVLNWTSIDRADPAAWVGEARRRLGGSSPHEVIENLQGQVAELMAARQASDTELSEARRAISDRDGRIDDLEGEIAARDDRISDLERALETAAEGLRTAEADAAAARATVQAHKDAVANAQRRVHAAEKQAQPLATQLHEASEARVRAERMIEDLRAEQDAERTVWERQLQAAQAETDALRSANTSLRAENDRLMIEAARPPSVSAIEVNTTSQGEEAERTNPDTSEAEHENARHPADTRPELLAIAGAAVLGVVIVVLTWRGVGARRGVFPVVTLRCRAAATDPWTPVEIPLKRSEAIVIRPERPPAAEAIGKIDGAAHLVVRGEGLEFRDERPGAVFQVNDTSVKGTRARVRLGDRLQVRHPDGRTTALIVSAINKSTRSPSAAANVAPVVSPA